MLTDIEKETSLKVAELVEGDLVGVDLLPAKDREKDKPYIFLATPEHTKECLVIPMDENGGVRIKERKFSYIKKTCAD